MIPPTSRQQEEQYRGFTSGRPSSSSYGLGLRSVRLRDAGRHARPSPPPCCFTSAELKQPEPTPDAEGHQFHPAIRRALSFVILPILPSEDFGPYNAINPRQITVDGGLDLRPGLAGFTSPCASSAPATVRRCSASSAVWPHRRRRPRDVLAPCPQPRRSGPRVGHRHPHRQRDGDDPLGAGGRVVAPHLSKPIAIVFLCGIVPGVAMAPVWLEGAERAENLPMPEVKKLRPS